MKLWIVALFCAVSAVQAGERPWTRIAPSASVELRDPRSLSVASDGIIYVADTGHHRVVAFDSNGALVAETGGFGNAHGQFQWPRTVVADRGNAVWVLDYGNRRIEKFTRLFEYQGTLEIRVAGEERPNQPEALALSPQGDLFVYDRDEGRLLRYDPLFTLQAESGSGSGSQFISNITEMVFLPRRGLYWWERGSGEIRRTDPLLNAKSPLRIRALPNDATLTAADTCLLICSPQNVLKLCSDDDAPDKLWGAPMPGDSSALRITAAGFGGEWLYVLDRGKARCTGWISGASE